MSMKILNVSQTLAVRNRVVKDGLRKSNGLSYLDTRSFNTSSLECLGNYNKALINFTGGYEGDLRPAKKMFWIVSGRNKIHKDEDIANSAWRVDTECGQKAWSTYAPWDLLHRNLEQAIQSICTLNNTTEIPDYILSPDYGDNWGRRANYIEINPRLMAIPGKDYKMSEGLLNTIKLLPAIPPSTKSIPNCLILSQIYPTMNGYGDGFTCDVGIYCIDFNAGISKNLTSENLKRGNTKMTDEEQVKAFNDLAHFRGFKTGARLPISEGQMSVNGRPFNWDYDTNVFIEACCDLVNLGFDCIYIDSGKHVGNYQMEHYQGVGRVPEYHQMQYITDEVRKRTGRGDISFVAEKTDTNPRYEALGYTAGTDWGIADDFNNLLYEYNNQYHNLRYAAGPVISDDNDNGAMSYEQRLNRIRNTLHSFSDSYHKLPVHFQMHDILPLSEYTNTHETMMKSTNRSTSGKPEGHYDNIFSRSINAREHTMNVYREFESIMNC